MSQPFQDPWHTQVNGLASTIQRVLQVPSSASTLASAMPMNAATLPPPTPMQHMSNWPLEMSAGTVYPSPPMISLASASSNAPINMPMPMGMMMHPSAAAFVPPPSMSSSQFPVSFQPLPSPPPSHLQHPMGHTGQTLDFMHICILTIRSSDVTRLTKHGHGVVQSVITNIRSVFGIRAGENDYGCQQWYICGVCEHASQHSSMWRFCTSIRDEISKEARNPNCLLLMLDACHTDSLPRPMSSTSTRDRPTGSAKRYRCTSSSAEWSAMADSSPSSRASDLQSGAGIGTTGKEKSGVHGHVNAAAGGDGGADDDLPYADMGKVLNELTYVVANHVLQTNVMATTTSVPARTMIGIWYINGTDPVHHLPLQAESDGIYRRLKFAQNIARDAMWQLATAAPHPSMSEGETVMGVHVPVEFFLNGLWMPRPYALCGRLESFAAGYVPWFQGVQYPIQISKHSIHATLAPAAPTPPATTGASGGVPLPHWKRKIHVKPLYLRVPAWIMIEWTNASIIVTQLEQEAKTYLYNALAPLCQQKPTPPGPSVASTGGAAQMDTCSTMSSSLSSVMPVNDYMASRYTYLAWTLWCGICRVAVPTASKTSAAYEEYASKCTEIRHLIMRVYELWSCSLSAVSPIWAYVCHFIEMSMTRAFPQAELASSPPLSTTSASASASTIMPSDNKTSSEDKRTAPPFNESWKTLRSRWLTMTSQWMTMVSTAQVIVFPTYTAITMEPWDDMLHITMLVASHIFKYRHAMAIATAMPIASGSMGMTSMTFGMYLASQGYQHHELVRMLDTLSSNPTCALYTSCFVTNCNNFHDLVSMLQEAPEFVSLFYEQGIPRLRYWHLALHTQARLWTTRQVAPQGVAPMSTSSAYYSLDTRPHTGSALPALTTPMTAASSPPPMMSSMTGISQAQPLYAPWFVARTGNSSSSSTAPAGPTLPHVLDSKISSRTPGANQQLADFTRHILATYHNTDDDDSTDDDEDKEDSTNGHDQNPVHGTRGGGSGGDDDDDGDAIHITKTGNMSDVTRTESSSSALDYTQKNKRVSLLDGKTPAAAKRYHAHNAMERVALIMALQQMHKNPTASSSNTRRVSEDEDTDTREDGRDEISSFSRLSSCGQGCYTRYATHFEYDRRSRDGMRLIYIIGTLLLLVFLYGVQTGLWTVEMKNDGDDVTKYEMSRHTVLFLCIVYLTNSLMAILVLYILYRRYYTYTDRKHVPVKTSLPCWLPHLAAAALCIPLALFLRMQWKWNSSTYASSLSNQYGFLYSHVLIYIWFVVIFVCGQLMEICESRHRKDDSASLFSSAASVATTHASRPSTSTYAVRQTDMGRARQKQD